MSLLLLFRPSAGGSTIFVVDSDSGAGTEAASLLAALVGSEAGSGSDTAVLAAVLSAAEAGSGADVATLAAIWALTDTAAGTEGSVGLSAVLSGTDDGSGGDSSEASNLDPIQVDGGLDICFSVDSVGDRQMAFLDTAAGVDGGEVIVYLIRILSDDDACLGTELQFLETAKRRNTALSHLGGWADEGSITYPKPGV